MIEWYDFYIFGSLATVIATKFFPGADPTAPAAAIEEPTPWSQRNA